MNSTYLLLGSNLGNSKQAILDAIEYIEKDIGRLVNKSGLYQTAAWGKTDQPDFINQVILVETNLSALETLHMILLIEEKMGRIRKEKNAERIIDIDILFFNNDIIKTTLLTVPHPFIQDRKFVLVPLNELAPGLYHPLLEKTVAQLLKACKDKLDVKKIKFSY